MGTIVTLPQPRRKRLSVAPTTNKATILLFMGVRYVRDFDDAPTSPTVSTAMPDRVMDCAPLEIA